MSLEIRNSCKINESEFLVIVSSLLGQSYFKWTNWKLGIKRCSN